MVLLLLQQVVQSQSVKDEDVVGIHTLKTNSLSGYQRLVLLPNHKFFYTYYGGIFNGDWHIANDTIYFVPNAAPHFMVYGRKRKALKDTTQILMLTDRKEQTLINYGNQSTHMQPLFNKEPDCFGYNYSIKTTKTIKTLKLSKVYKTQEELLAEEEYKYKVEEGLEPLNEARIVPDSLRVYTFKLPKKYNDFVTVNLPRIYTVDEINITTYRDGIFYNGRGAFSTSKADLNSMSADKLNAYISKSNTDLLPEVLRHGDEFFPDIERLEYHKENYKNFIALPFTTKQEHLNVAAQSVFTAKCKD